MKFLFLNTGSHTGKFNMEFDVALAGLCRPDDFYFRLYTWQPYCLSLGANQPDTSVDKQKLQDAGVDLVRRPSGGKAILHAEELTYSVVCHTSIAFTPQQIYRTVNEALLAGLARYDVRLGQAELEGKQPDFRSLFNKEGNFACFGSSAKNELKFDHKKLIGSAQRKMGDVVLQHGSILCGGFHKKITDFLFYDGPVLESLKQELLDRTIELDTVLGAPVDINRLCNCLRAGFEDYFKAQFSEVNTDELLQKLQIDETVKQ